jgi:hypothetical protein
MKQRASVPTELMHNLLLSIVAFMTKTGMATTDIERAFRACLDEVERLPEGLAARPDLFIGCDTIAGAVLRAWHRDGKYLDDAANPIPLGISRGTKSLTTLIRSQDPDADAGSLIAEMQRTGLIKRARNRQFLPTTSAATIRQLHPLAVDHVAKTVMRLVETVNRNTHVTTKEMPLIERYAHVPDLDARDAQAFAEFTRQQGAACLEAIEDWLESRRVPTARGRASQTRSVSAGMHVFAYVGEGAEESRQKRTKQPQRLTSPRAMRA